MQDLGVIPSCVLVIVYSKSDDIYAHRHTPIQDFCNLSLSIFEELLVSFFVQAFQF